MPLGVGVADHGVEHVDRRHQEEPGECREPGECQEHGRDRDRGQRGQPNDNNESEATISIYIFKVDPKDSRTTTTLRLDRFDLE